MGLNTLAKSANCILDYDRSRPQESRAQAHTLTPANGKSGRVFTDDGEALRSYVLQIAHPGSHPDHAVNRLIKGAGEPRIGDHARFDSAISHGDEAWPVSILRARIQGHDGSAIGQHANIVRSVAPATTQPLNVIPKLPSFS